MMAATIVQINFKFAGSKEEYQRVFAEAAAAIAATAGLRWKVWPWNDEAQEGGGIYLFDDAASAQAFLTGPIAATLGQMPAVSDISVKQFEVLEGLTTITRGPI
jgi:hypothetical protein